MADQPYTLDFNLTDDSGFNLLPITDNANNLLLFEIENRGNDAVILNKPETAGAVANENNFHFELVFRPGVFDEGGINNTALGEKNVEWDLGRKTNENKTVSLYFLAKEAKTIASNETILITLKKIRANEQAVKQTPVRFKSRNLSISQDLVREKYMNISPAKGRRKVPANVSFLGSNIILNDGNTPNTLTLEITNLLKQGGILLNTEASPAPTSRFIISFDAGDATNSQLACLATKEQLEGIRINNARKGDENIDWSITKSQESASPAWEILPQTPAGDTRTQIELKALQLEIFNIITAMPQGNANLYLNYENLPGYLDGQFICTIQKSNIIYMGDRIGIGTNNPIAKMEVGGKLVAKKYLKSNGYSIEGPLSKKNSGNDKVEVQNGALSYNLEGTIPSTIKVDFSEPFSTPPKVIVSQSSAKTGDDPGEIAAFTTYNITKNTFEIHVISLWGNTNTSIELFWMAWI